VRPAQRSIHAVNKAANRYPRLGGLEALVLCASVSTFKLEAVDRGLKGLKGSWSVLVVGVSEIEDLTALALVFKLDDRVSIGLVPESNDGNDCGCVNEPGTGIEDGLVGRVRPEVVVADSEPNEYQILLAVFDELAWEIFSPELIDTTTGPGPKCNEDNTGVPRLPSKM
jgi:hypothetical protein